MDVKGLPQSIPSADCLAIAQLNQKQSPLLRLPGELRSRIYDFVMDTHINEIIHEDLYDWNRLDFSRTCRQIFAETANAYFKKRLLPLNTPKGVSFCDIENWETVFDRLTPNQKRHIKVFVLPAEHFFMRLRPYQMIQLVNAMPCLRVFKIVDPCFRQPFHEMEWNQLDQELAGCSSARLHFVHEQHGSLEL